jgi:hypothetical protein
VQSDHARRGRGRLRDARTAVADLGVGEIALGDDAAARLAGLRAETGLKMPDCRVLLAVEDARAEAVLTCDDRLARATEQRGLPSCDPFRKAAYFTYAAHMRPAKHTRTQPSTDRAQERRQSRPF